MPKKEKTILLLGGSAQQLVAIRAAKALGLRTVLCDYLPDNPGQYEVDKYYNVSTTDVEAVYKVAKEEKADGVLAYASDPAAVPAAIVCERLGLPTNPVAGVEVLGIKHKFRDFLAENGFACPKHIAISPADSPEEVLSRMQGFKYPIVVKPTDSSGSKGVTMLSSSEGMARAISHADANSRNKVLIVEEFIERGFPYVIAGDIFIEDGKITLYGDMASFRSDDGRSLIPIGERMPSGLNPAQTKALHAELQRMVDALGIRFGEMNIELLLDKEDNVHFLELGPRAGGNMIPVVLSDAFGIDLPKANVEAAMGMPVSMKPKAQPGCFANYVLHSYSDGIYRGLEISPEIGQYAYKRCMYKKEGDKVEAFDGAGKALGILFLRFPDEETLNRIYPRAEELIQPILD